MSSRSRRRSTVQASELSIRAQKDKELSNVERLLLSQAVYEVGADSWSYVAKLLVNHPLITRPKTFNAQTCRTYYHQIMNAAGLEIIEACSSPKANVHLRLAHIHYAARMNELRSLVAAEETKFNVIVHEIEEIRSGRWDRKIKGDLTAEDALNIAEATGGLKIEQDLVSNHAELQEPVEQTQEPLSAPYSSSALEEHDAEHGVLSEEAEVHDFIMHDGHEDDLDDEAVMTTSRPEEQTSMELEVQDSFEGQSPEDTGPEVDQQDAEYYVDGIQVQSQGSDEMENGTKVEPAEDIPLHNTRGASRKRRLSSLPTPRPMRISRSQKPLPEDTSEGAKPQNDLQSRENKRKISATEAAEPPRHSKRLREDSETVDEDEAVTTTGRRRRGQAQAQTEDKIAAKRFQNVIGLLHEQISRHRNGTIFHNPIKKSEAPDYRDIVKRPMDLKTIKSKVKDGSISNSSEYERDIVLMFANAMMYNRPGSDVYEMAESMMFDSEKDIQSFRETEVFHRAGR